MKRFLTALVVCSFLIGTAGCGQSGPLYLPGNPSTIQQPPPPPEPTAEEESEENGDAGTE
jgi:predicted small lipoprotein YifL